MADHNSNRNSSTNKTSITQDIGDFSDDSENIIAGKSGNAFLIKLYKERPFLYDKRNINFKNSLMKQNAWCEISKKMIEANYGDIYTPNYCQRRCISLREQYNREKKRMEMSKSKTTPNPNSRQVLLYSQLTFLDEVIKRRKTYSRATRHKSDAISIDENSSEIETHVSRNINILPNKENQKTKHKGTEMIDTDNTYKEVLTRSSKLKIRKVDETQELEPTFLNMSNRIMNHMENSKTADDAFMEFIKIQFNNIPEHEKNIRRKMMIDALSTPLPKK